MKAAELRDMSVEELGGRERELRSRLFDLRMRHNTGVLESTAEIKVVKHDLARVLTVRSELEHKHNPEGKRPKR